ncbi:hypothetical protein LX36DRAFT_668319 [Colletotrichum falcatum]|nr:hypothetical protein LX36DRAFT_668319 [Colletotrichum falcatum]
MGWHGKSASCFLLPALSAHFSPPNSRGARPPKPCGVGSTAAGTTADDSRLYTPWTVISGPADLEASQPVRRNQFEWSRRCMADERNLRLVSQRRAVHLLLPSKYQPDHNLVKCGGLCGACVSYCCLLDALGFPKR